MGILLILLCAACICLGWLWIRLRMDICCLDRQLDEIGRGSHIELAVNSRQKSLLALCRKLNQVLSSRDADHIRHEKSEKQLKQNITSLAHDIRTPLTGASGYLLLARETQNPEKKARCLQAASDRMAELKDMLEELFLYTRLASGDFEFPPEKLRRIQVFPLLGECLLSLYSRFESAGISPEISFQSENFCVLADEDSLTRIFLNLIQNALLHGSGGLIVTQQEGFPDRHSDNENSRTEGVFVTFANPLPQDSHIDTARIFERFYKADPARGKGSSGLGLFIVKELMEKMGGSTWAESDGKNLKIILFFPPEAPS